MGKWIDADALIMALRLEYPMIPMFKENQEEWGIKTEGYRKAEEVIKDAPTIETKRGEWIPCTKSGLALTELMRREGQKWYGYRCSNCNHIYKGNALTDCNFCCACGADMRGEGND